MDKELIKRIADNINKVNNSERLYETLLDIEGLLDKFGLYAYENWFEGEVVNGPTIKRHWVEVILMYEHRQMPDPDGGMRLIKHGCMVFYQKSSRPVIVMPEPGSGGDPIDRDSVEVREKKIWLVTIKIPKTLLDELDDSMVAVGEIEIDNEDVGEFIDDGEDVEKNENEIEEDTYEE